MKKLVYRRVNLNFLSCPTCGDVSVIMISRSKGLDGFIKHGCRHSVAALLSHFLNVELKTRKAARVAANPNGRKAKKRKS